MRTAEGRREPVWVMARSAWVVLAWMAILPVLVACGADAQDKPASPLVPRDPLASDCKAGEPCACANGGGVTTCSGGIEACACPACPGLQFPKAHAFHGCGGDPTGTWRLKELQLAPGSLTLKSGGSSVGTCDTLQELVGPVPKALMLLTGSGNSGAAQYYADAARVKQSWSESCVISKVSQFTCGSSYWTGVSNCKLACDICACDNPTIGSAATSAAPSSWQRTDTTLTVSPWGEPLSADYCVSAERLDLATEDGSYVGYERVYTRAAPGPCELKDFGVVPGCDLSTSPPTCVGQAQTCGDPTRTCEAQDAWTCKDVPGCTLNTKGRCGGPTLKCSDFIGCPFMYCNDTGAECLGTTSCGAFTNTEDCFAIGRTNHPDKPCEWEPSFCEGSPTTCVEMACGDVAPDACDAVPGCHLQYP